MYKKSSFSIKLAVTLGLVVILGTYFVGAAPTEQEVKINAEIGAKLAFEVSRGKLKIPVDPLETPRNRDSLVFIVKTNAPFYDITASHSTFEVKDYDLIDKGNFWVRSDYIDGEGTNGWKEVKNEMELITGETGRTNREETSATYQLRVDYRVPFGKAETTVLFTASVST
ncbi:hypothetical protein KGY71_02080 [Candidatus Bipolaricaulota bacterium]|nr:hypothetical protein [Candidatus Bipolaricaulota bacterium]